MKNGKKSGRKAPREELEAGNPFEDFLEDFAADPEQPLKFLRAFMAGEEAYNPAVDVVEEPTRLVLIADLPGVAEKDLKIEFVEGGVVLRGRREPAAAQLRAERPSSRGERPAEGRLRRSERPAGEFTKSVPLPRGLETHSAQAKIENGVLTLTIPRDGDASKRLKLSEKSEPGGGDS